jgi:hypothetical protein
MPTTEFITKFRDEFEAYLAKTAPAQTPELAVI